MEIIKIDQHYLADINKTDNPLEIIGEIKPTLADGICKEFNISESY